MLPAEIFTKHAKRTPALTGQMACVIIISVNILWSTAEVKAIIITVYPRDPDCIPDNLLFNSHSDDRQLTHNMLYTIPVY